jgi:UDP:flavonoid glycosyltransferase YjiC (YdhE family)
VQWSPELAPPAFWDDPRLDRDSVYVTLGSSGKVDRLPTALKGLASVGLTSMVATAGRCALPERSAQLFAADYLPGSEAARRARFVLCNGGSSTAYQALSEGKPVLGIASNLDQYLAMSAIADRGAGILLRGSTVTPELVARAARRLLDEPSFTLAAQRAQRELRAFDCTRRFADVLASLWPQHERELRVS